MTRRRWMALAFAVGSILFTVGGALPSGLATGHGRLRRRQTTIEHDLERVSL